MEWSGSLPILRCGTKPIHFKVMGCVGASGLVEIFCYDDDTTYYLQLPTLEVRRWFGNGNHIGKMFRLCPQKIRGYPVHWVLDEFEKVR